MEETMLWIVSGLVGLGGIIGLFLASGAADTGIYVFGMGLFVFAVLFIFSRIKGAYDSTETEARGRQAA